MAQDIYFSGQGILYMGLLYTHSSGVGQLGYKGFIDLGNIRELQISLETDKLEHKETRTGQRLTDLRITKERRASIKVTLESFNRTNLSMLLYGTYGAFTNATAANITTTAGGAIPTGALTITSGGSGYTTPPTVRFTLSNGTPILPTGHATSTVTIAGGAVTGATITGGGTGYGASVVLTPQLCIGETLPDPLLLGDVFVTKYPFINQIVSFVSGAAQTTTFSAGTHYVTPTPASLAGGLITLGDGTFSGGVYGGTVQSGIRPWNIFYTSQSQDNIPMFRDVQQERFLRFSGLNTANSNKPVVVELYRTVFDPVANFELINDDIAQFELEGSILYDATRDTDSSLGGFGRILQQ